MGGFYRGVEANETAELPELQTSEQKKSLVNYLCLYVTSIAVVFKYSVIKCKNPAIKKSTQLN